MTKETENFRKAEDLLMDLFTDVFSIIEHGFGETIASALWDKHITDEERCCDCPEVAPCKKEDVVPESLEPSRQDFERLMSALEILGKLHGLDRK